tara:strand:- start:2726 stop:3250 length:525 start_codon:yes stop_codon:yes gene_type:complete
MANKYTEKSHCYIIGYGSLVNTNNRNKTAITKAEPVIIDKNFNYIRIYNDCYSNLPSLGIKKVTKNDEQSCINGVIFKVNKQQLKLFDQREGMYNRIRIPQKYIYKYKPDQNHKKTNIRLPIYIYVTKNTYLLNNRYKCDKKNNKNYINIVMEGFKEYGDKFYNLFLLTTKEFL